MSLWWIPVGIVAWFLIAIVAGLCIGPVLGRRSPAGEAAGKQWMAGQQWMNQTRASQPGGTGRSRQDG